MKHNPIVGRNLMVVATVLALCGTALWWLIRQMPSSENPIDVRGNLPTANSVAVPSKAVIAPAHPPDGAMPRKFNLMSGRESRAILREIANEDMNSIFQHFLDSGRIENDPMKQSGIADVLKISFTEKDPTPEFTEKMRRFVSDRSNSVLERGLIVHAYAQAGTKTGAEFALWAATGRLDAELKGCALDGVEYLPGGVTREYLHKMLEPLWRESNDPALLKAVAFAMARDGAPSSIELLLPASAAPDGEDEVRRLAAVKALGVAYSEKAVPPLAAALMKEPLGSRTHTMAFRTLWQIGGMPASEAIIGWLQNADSSASELTRQWISNVKTDAQIKAAEKALNSAVPFRSEENREALRVGVEAYRAR